MPSRKATQPAATLPRSTPSPVVAIIGRPNVGKSSLFNAIAGRRTAIVSEVSGTTRDRLAEEVEHLGRRMLLVDTGGLVPEPDTEMEAHIAAQVDTAVQDADVILFVTDARDGVTHADRSVAQRLRRAGTPLALAVNKADNSRQETLAPEHYELGLGEPIPVSAQHRRGIDEILDSIVSRLPKQEIEGPAIAGAARIAIIGRPNVGKSALTNAILGIDRSIVSPVPGTTRDAIDSPFTFENEPGVLIDTAGIRRRGAIVPGIERYSVLRAVRALDRSDAALIVMDATEPATDQDLHIAGTVMESFKAAVVVLNKWDLAGSTGIKDERAAVRFVRSRLRFLPDVPVVLTSATEGEGIETLLRTTFTTHRKRLEWLPAPELTRTVMGAIARHLPPGGGHGTLKIYRVKQEAVGPPTFVFYCNNPHRVHFSYERFLENEIRQAFGFDGTHLRLEFRGKGKIHVIGQKHAPPPAQQRQARRPSGRPAPGRPPGRPPGKQR
jgi:GTP-binding protein